VTGDGLADTGAALSNLGITTAELQQLAGLYPAGQELWRVPIPHFSPWDFNWPFGPGPDAVEPPTPPEGGDQPSPCSESGSVINCDAQTLGESLPLVGTPFNLHYASQRTPGWQVGNIVDIPVTVGTPPTGLKAIGLNAQVGGQTIFRRWGRGSAGNTYGITGLYSGTIGAIGPDISVRLVWDGKDGYGRLTNGRPLARFDITYVYDFTYYTARSDFEQSFAQFGEQTFVNDGRQYCEYLDYPPAAEVAFDFCGINVVRAFVRPMGHWDALASAGLGGWTLDAQHAYDINEGVVHLGDGRDLRTADVGAVMTAVLPETTTSNYLGDVAVASDGTIYFLDVSDRKIYRLNRDGSKTVMAGNGSQGYPTGDGGPATAATLGWYLNALEAGPDGSLYLATTYDNFNVGLIRKITPDGVINTIAGVYYTTSYQSNGDGGPALDARLNAPVDLLLAPDGNLYIGETPLYRYSGGNLSRIRAISPSGIITTIAGGGSNNDTQADVLGVRAREWSALPDPGRMALGPDGSLYVPFPNAATVARITPDGMLTRFAGSGIAQEYGDGGPATSAGIPTPLAAAVDENGLVYIRSRYFNDDRVRRVTPEGLITTHAGKPCTVIQDNNGLPARQACLTNQVYNNSLVMTPDGVLLVSSTRSRLERIEPPRAPGGSVGATFLIPAPDGSEVWEFSSTGRHLRTLHPLTGAALYTFDYDSAGRLIAVLDVDGNRTTIERSPTGAVSAIVAPGGQRTTLSVNTDGFLSIFTNPLNQVTTLGYTSSGLLTSLSDPRGGLHSYSYDADGRLVLDSAPNGQSKSLTRTEAPGHTTVTVATAQNQVTTYELFNLPNGDLQRKVTSPDGTAQTLTISEGSLWTLEAPDGTTYRVTYGPDPRWGMSAPLPASVVISTTGGLLYQIAALRTATLASPSNLFSLSKLEEQRTINGRIWRYTYTANDRAVELKTPTGRIFRNLLDAAGRAIGLVRDSSGGLANTNLSYDSRGRLIQITQQARTTTLGYTTSNWLNSITAPDGAAANLTVNAGGLVTAFTRPDGQTLSFAYDAAGNLTSLTPPGKPAHTLAYNLSNLPTTYTPPGGLGAYTYQYDSGGNLTNYTRPDARSLSVGYEFNGFRVGAVNLQRGAVTNSFDAAGRLAGLSDPSGVGLAYTYNGPLVAEKIQTGPVPGTLSFSYNPQWLVSSISLNGANPLAYAYDNDDLLVQAGALALTRAASTGLVTGSALGGVSDAWTYNAYAEAAAYSASYNSSPLYAFTLTRDLRGRITRKVETTNGATNTYDYTYDVLGRLTQVQKNGSSLASYTYDANGNRTGASGEAASYDVQDRLASRGATTYTYSAAGERLSKTSGGQTTSYTYDEVGNLLTVTLPDGRLISYLPDGFNRRTAKKVNAAAVQGFLYQDSYRIAAELDGAGSVVSRFVYGARGNVPEYMLKDGQTYRILSDPVGSVRLVVNTATGQVAQRMDYDAWGNVIQDTSPGFQPFGFAGGLYDRDTGLVRFGLRDYDPAAGRWTTKDPLGFSAGDSNLYAYAANDPLNRIDPTGLEDGASPSPCQPEETWDQKARKVLDSFKRIPDHLKQGKIAKTIDKVWGKIKKLEKLMDDGLEVKEALESPDTLDSLTAVEKGMEYIDQPVPITPIEAVKETISQARKAMEVDRSRLDRIYRSGNPNSYEPR
jgi:RHS repeat-associated protein